MVVWCSRPRRPPEKFRFEVVQRRQEKRHVQSRCFANLTLFYFSTGLVVVVTCMFGSMADPASNNVALKRREHLTLQ